MVESCAAVPARTRRKRPVSGCYPSVTLLATPQGAARCSLGQFRSKDDGQPLPRGKPVLQQCPCSRPRLARAKCEIPRLHTKHLHSANVPAGGTGQVHFRPGSPDRPITLRRNSVPTPSAVLLAFSFARAAALDCAEPRAKRPGLGPETVAPSRP